MSDTKNEVYRQHRAAQEKYTYFLLAAAVAAIGFSVQRTFGLRLEWSMIPLGLAVLAWGASFYCGCTYVNYVSAILFANLDLLRVQGGMHPEVGGHPQAIDAASEGIKSAVTANSATATRFVNAQFRLLVAGGVLFIVWHVINMASHTA